METRLRVGRAIGKEEAEVAAALMEQLKRRGHPMRPPPMASDGKGAYGEAMLETWGEVPPYGGRGRPPSRKRPGSDWQYLQVVKHGRDGGEVRVIYGDANEVRELMGEHTAYVERTHLTSRQMNGRLVRKTLSYSKKVEMLEAACAWEDNVYNLTRALRTLHREIGEEGRRWQPRTPAMAAGLTDHIWTLEELLTTLPTLYSANSK